MKLKLKRLIVREFLSGKTLFAVVMENRKHGGLVDWGSDHCEQVLRDYIQGKFSLTSKERK